MASAARRYKLSTTIAQETRLYLEHIVREGRARDMAEAVDQAVARVRRTDNRARLEAETAAYYASLSSEALREEQQLEDAVAHTASTVDFDAE
jgi:23S rRNA A2030 N6-methylase RlmJ